MTIEMVGLDELIPSEILESVGPKATQAILENIANAAWAEWKRLAENELFTSRNDYVTSIQPVKMGKGVATISLVGQLANLIEEGMDSVDMHDTLLGPNVPISEVGEFGKHIKFMPGGGMGFYRAVPFRHAVPTSGGTVGMPMGRAYGASQAVADSQALGKAVYAKAKKLKGTTSVPYGKTKYGGRLEAGLAPKLKAHHSVDIYAGMIRSRKKYQSATQSQYTTFRTISTGSPGWLRPATQGKFYSQQVNTFVQKIAPQAFEAYVKAMTG